MNKEIPKQIGHYKILAQIGSGGMGKVYKAYDPHLDRVVAIKVVFLHNTSNEFKKRFARETKIMAQFKHPNIITLYDAATDVATGLDYIVMDFIEGEDLSNKNLHVRKALNIIKGVALALDYAHKQGIIHRDLKPTNVMIKKNGQPMIMDFGLAKDIKDKNITQTGTIMGTPRYMAPEQAQGKIKEICPQTDVYALGAIAYELLTGKPAVEGQTPAQVIYNLSHNKPTPLQKHNPKLASELEVICAKAISDFSQVIFLNPRFLTAYKNRGFAYSNLKKYDKAISDYSQAISLNPRSSLPYANRGSIYLNIQKYQKAYRDFQVFLQLAPHHPTASQIRKVIKSLRKNNLLK